MDYIKSQEKESERYLSEIKTNSTLQAYKKRSYDAVNFFIPFIKKNDQILDIGCRDGKMMAILISRGYTKISGIDIIPKVVEIATNNGLSCKVGDVHDLNSLIAEGSIDFIIASHVLEHCHTIKKALENICKSLTTGGRIFIELPLGRSDKPGEWGHYVNFKDHTQVINLISKYFKISKMQLDNVKQKWVRMIGSKVL